MNKIHKNTQGFTLIEVLLIVIALTLISFAGWYVFNANKKDDTIKPTASSQKSDGSSAKKEVALKTYSNTEYGFSAQYPENWKVSEDLKDIGRDANEGDVVLLSPNDTKVNFNLNQGGKGGDCWDEQADARTARTCETLDVLSVKKLSGSSKQLYFYEASVTAAARDGGAKEYFVYIDSGDNAYTEKGSHLGMFGPASHLDAKNGYIDITITGKDDTIKNSAKFLQSREVQEATTILQSFKLQ